jgi:hypothetical protein
VRGDANTEERLETGRRDDLNFVEREVGRADTPGAGVRGSPAALAGVLLFDRSGSVGLNAIFTTGAPFL